MAARIPQLQFLREKKVYERFNEHFTVTLYSELPNQFVALFLRTDIC